MEQQLTCPRCGQLWGVNGHACPAVPTRVQISLRFVRELGPGETWTTHPSGGIIVAHPDRKPLWCREAEDGSYVQEWLEPQSLPGEVTIPPGFTGTVVLGPRWR